MRRQATPEQEARYARLVEAAPYMLYALKEAENALSDYVPTLEAAGGTMGYGRSVLHVIQVAIAKAEGV
jgi:hypothetical protein